MIKVLINVLLSLTGVAYPIIWLFAEDQTPLFYLPWIMALLWAAKGFFQQQGQRYFAWAMALILAVVGITRSVETMFWYPIIINGLMLSLFGGSLWSEQTVVERLARLQTPDLSEAGVRYTRKVTQLWCGVFVINIVIIASAIWLKYYDFWALYTGVLSYCFIGMVMAGEWLVRQKVKKQQT
ncbi:hypothetical protein FXN59_04090 [Aggregatibacter actinomycetemcomitans]|uniref:COG4648 family protein n=1 Tax=Aggregatibacter actinomycetemcomitans TaxID=714 RepID=UPI0011E0A358|nr:hypothetical protein [Aggregatibacter actinomycetemcomitans]QEH46918.1 hypothetical protein FXN59_04090 [Aggregatibacter actinomycetemcomitans]